MTDKFNWDTGGGEGGTPPLNRQIIAGAGLSGGGDLSADVTLDVGQGNGILVGENTVAVRLAATSGLAFDLGTLLIDDAIAGDGLGITNKILAVGAGDGLTVGASSIALTTPGTLDVSSSNNAAGSHTHAITNASNVIDGHQHLLSSDATGALFLAKLGVGIATTGDNKVEIYNGSFQIDNSGVNGVLGDSIFFANINYLTSYRNKIQSSISQTPGDGKFIFSLAVTAPATLVDVLIIKNNGRVGINIDPAYALDVNGTARASGLRTSYITHYEGTDNITIEPSGDIIFHPIGQDVRPSVNYETNLGTITKKYLTIHAAELWVETLVAQNTIATIGGRILVGPTTTLVLDFPVMTNNCLNPGFETYGGGTPDEFANWEENWGDGSVWKETTNPHNGTTALGIQSGPTANTVVYQTITCTVGDIITFSFWTKGDGVNAGRYGVRDDSNATWIIPITSTGITEAIWKKVAGVFGVPAGFTTGRFTFFVPPVNGSYAWFDDVEITNELVWVKHNQMHGGDIAYMEANGKIEFMQVLGGPWGSSGLYAYTVIRDIDNTGMNDWYAGDALFNTGSPPVAGVYDGFIDLYSISSMRPGGMQYGPTITGNVRTGWNYTDLAEVWAIGNLNGLYGYNTNIFGAAFGQYENGKSFVTVDATDGIRMRYKIGANDYTNAQWNLDGSLIIGKPTGFNTQINSNGFYVFNNGASNILLTAFDGLVLSDGVTGGYYTQVNAGFMAFCYNSEAWLGVYATGGNSVLRIGRVGPSQNRIDINSGAVEWIYRDSSNADHRIANISITDSGVYADMIIGDYLAGKANMAYDGSEGRLKFRVGTTSKSYIDTTGAFVVIGSTGGIYDRTAAVTWNDGTDDIATIGSYSSGPLVGVELKTLPVTGKYSNVYITAESPSGNAVGVSLKAKSGADYMYLTINSDNAYFICSQNSKLQLGDSSNTVDLWYSGKMVSHRSTGLTYNTWPFSPLTTPLGSTSWDGDGYSSTGSNQQLDLSAVFGAPPGIKAVLVSVSIKDSGSTDANDLFLAFTTSSGSSNYIAIRAMAEPSKWFSTTVVVPCDTNGDVWYKIVASGTNTLSIFLAIWGYWI